MKPNGKTNFYRFAPLLTGLLVLLLSGIPALANEMGQHHDGEEMSEHMQAMMEVKKEIPEEYRIMERSPLFPDEESLTQGKKLFLKNCSVCHGNKGDGQGPAAAGMQTPPANFLDLDHSAIYGPGDKFWIIGHGNQKTGMPAFPQLSPVERWRLVNYILHLQQQNSGEEQEHHEEHKHHQ